MRRATTSKSILAALGAIATLSALSGCYEKTTRASGFGAETRQVEKGNLDDGPINNALYGDHDRRKTSKRPGTGSSDR